MARARKVLPSGVEAQLAEFAARDVAANTVVGILSAQGHKGLCERLIQRRMREYRLGLKKPAYPTPASSPPLPQTPNEVPENATVELYNDWIDQAQRLTKIAEANDDLEGFAKMARVASQLIAAKIKATPPDAPRPEDNPDMVALGKLATSKLHSMVEKVAGKP